VARRLPSKHLREEGMVTSSSTPRHARGLGGYCWAEHPTKGVHCTEPVGHPPRDGKGGHWHPYSKTAW
jgi:hypothetical protein